MLSAKEGFCGIFCYSIRRLFCGRIHYCLQFVLQLSVLVPCSLELAESCARSEKTLICFSDFKRH